MLKAFSHDLEFNVGASIPGHLVLCTSYNVEIVNDPNAELHFILVRRESDASSFGMFLCFSSDFSLCAHAPKAFMFVSLLLSPSQRRLERIGISDFVVSVTLQIG
jgi:hypothetical protein